VPKGGPDGGDGGRGGDVILKVDPHVDNLTNLFYEPIIKAKSGGHGQGKKMYGRAATAKVVKVPVGTVVYRSDDAVAAVSDRRIIEKIGLDEESRKRPTPKAFASGALNAQLRKPSRAGRPTSNEEMPDAIAGPSTINHQPSAEAEPIADLTAAGQEFVLCRGGKGGKGNVHFKSSRNRAPVQYTEGGEGEEGHFLLELRTIADAGLVGYPNAGKSTLLRKISAARPKVAPYPFTTLHPIVGVVDFPGYRRATIADVPGLIEGAHRNVGLGHDFLRHITRCRLLLFVVDVAGSEGRNPIEDLQNLRREIDLYDPRLSQRPWFVIANKMDLPGASENLEALRKRFPSVEIVPISATRGEGIEDLKRKLAQWLTEEGVAVTAAGVSAEELTSA
jgi:GTP-binding protein